MITVLAFNNFRVLNSGGATPGRASSNDLAEKQMTCLLT